MKRELPLPQQPGYEQAYQQAFQLAAEQLANLDIEQQCRRSGSHYQETAFQRIITIHYINQPYQITLPEVEVRPKESKETVGIKERILILHYFNRAKGTPLSHNIITYKELPEGMVYFPTFSKRAIKPMVDHFGKVSERLVEIAQKLGSRRADYGDAAVTINAFNCVPITLVLWHGDEEFPPDGNILFDSTIFDYLDTEDINILCETIIWKLVRYLKSSDNRTR